jgi:hypothetical protein
VAFNLLLELTPTRYHTAQHQKLACICSLACRGWVSLLAFLLACCCFYNMVPMHTPEAAAAAGALLAVAAASLLWPPGMPAAAVAFNLLLELMPTRYHTAHNNIATSWPYTHQ